MTNKISKKLIILAVASSVSFAMPAQSESNAVVKNTFGNVIKNTFGNCVQTKWMVDNNECATKTVKPAMKQKVEVKMPEMKKYDPQEYSRSYMVFFDFNRSIVSSGAKDIISSLASSAKQKGAKVFELTGHADRVGSDAYNLALSKKRSDSVKNELMKMGFSSAHIATYAKGESAPLVPTADGIQEPQNRRVEILFKYDE